MRLRVSAVLAALLLVVTSCGGDEPAPKPSKAAKKTQAPPKPVICPLTGQETSKDFDVNRPALGVKVENSKLSRPQAGLENADIVYEVLAEGGITRFLAIFHCKDSDPLGPVRSARMADPDIMLEYAPALFAFSGGNPAVKDKVKATKGLVPLRHGEYGEAFRRQPGRSAPHNLFTTTAKLRALSDLSGGPKIKFQFNSAALTPASPSPTSTIKPKKSASASPSPSASTSPTPPPPGASVVFNYSGAGNEVRYAFDPGSGAYLRSHGTQAHNSAASGQLKATNVVVLKVKIVQGTIRDAAGNYSPEITVVGEGEAIVLRGGVSVTGKWKRSSLSDRTEFLDAAGKPVQLLPGTTWIHLIPNDRPVTVQ